ncbi:dihydrofolate synthase, partial [Gardnerella swidsinskii]|nr:dihydrofolate synthase [Gardnerella swidsinskii]
LRKTIEENYNFEQLIGVVAMMADKQVEEYLGVLEPILTKIIVTRNSWRDRVMDPKDLEKIAIGVFGKDRVIRIDDLPDAIQTAVNLV